MKLIHVCAVFMVGGAVAFGLFQRSRLSELRSEKERLQSLSTSPQGTTSSGRESATKLAQALPPLAGREHLTEIKSLISIGMGRGGNDFDPAEQEAAVVRLKSLMKGLGHEAAAQLIAEFRENPQTLPNDPLFRPHLEAWIIGVYVMENPSNVLPLIIQLRPELPGRQKLMFETFIAWMRADSAAALRWYQEQSDRTILDNDAMKEEVVIGYARLDPAKAVATALDWSRESSSWNADLVGSRVASTLRNTAERADFLNALHEAAKKSADAEGILALRAGYVSQLRGRLSASTFADATMVIDTYFNPEEKRQFMTESFPGDSEEPGKWATWLMKADAPVNWGHPVAKVIMSWTERDQAGAEAWLAAAADGEVKNVAIAVYVSRVTETDPENATKWVNKLPAGKDRQHLEHTIKRSIQEMEKSGL
jgi:hypothetical protein